MAVGQCMTCSYHYNQNNSIVLNIPQTVTVSLSRTPPPGSHCSYYCLHNYTFSCIVAWLDNTVNEFPGVWNIKFSTKVIEYSRLRYPCLHHTTRPILFCSVLLRQVLYKASDLVCVASWEMPSLFNLVSLHGMRCIFLLPGKADCHILKAWVNSLIFIH